PAKLTTLCRTVRFPALRTFPGSASAWPTVRKCTRNAQAPPRRTDRPRARGAGTAAAGLHQRTDRRAAALVGGLAAVGEDRWRDDPRGDCWVGGSRMESAANRKHGATRASRFD